jgi:hexosaminidase
MVISGRAAVGLMLLAAAAGATVGPRAQNQPPAGAPRVPHLVPLPAQIELTADAPFEITSATTIKFTGGDRAVARIAGELGELIRRATGFDLPKTAPLGAAQIIELIVDPTQPGGAESYALTIASGAVTLKARAAAGIFYGVQTIRQLLPPTAEYEAVLFLEPRKATLPALRIADSPRYAWRGAMLDVARHFFGPDDVKRYIDLVAMHKMNRLHLHLADDQGWRIEIKKWPRLTTTGAASEVRGTPGGFYTQQQFKEIVAYAADRFVTIVPEIDMPGHTNAALSSYAQLNCNGRATPVFTGTDVGFSSLCVGKEITYRFIEDVVKEITALAPGGYFHIGGDEVKTLKPEPYRAFVERVQGIVVKHGRQMLGWDEVAVAELHPTSVVQHWRPDASKSELARAPNLILSPADRTYLDMKYDDDTALGLMWAALIPVRAAYEWNPATLIPGAPASAILGVEAPLWSETTATMRDLEYLALPRLSAVAEIAWSPQERRNWDEFRVRLGAQGPRWTAIGLNFYRSPDVPWK